MFLPNIVFASFNSPPRPARFLEQSSTAPASTESSSVNQQSQRRDWLADDDAVEGNHPTSGADRTVSQLVAQFERAAPPRPLIADQSPRSTLSGDLHSPEHQDPPMLVASSSENFVRGFSSSSGSLSGLVRDRGTGVGAAVSDRGTSSSGLTSALASRGASTPTLVPRRKDEVDVVRKLGHRRANSGDAWNQRVALGTDALLGDHIFSTSGGADGGDEDAPSAPIEEADGFRGAALQAPRQLARSTSALVQRRAADEDVVMTAPSAFKWRKQLNHHRRWNSGGGDDLPAGFPHETRPWSGTPTTNPDGRRGGTGSPVRDRPLTLAGDVLFEETDFSSPAASPTEEAWSHHDDPFADEWSHHEGGESTPVSAKNSDDGSDGEEDFGGSPSSPIDDPQYAYRKQVPVILRKLSEDDIDFISAQTEERPAFELAVEEIDRELRESSSSLFRPDGASGVFMESGDASVEQRKQPPLLHAGVPNFMSAGETDLPSIPSEDSLPDAEGTPATPAFEEVVDHEHEATSGPAHDLYAEEGTISTTALVTLVSPGADEALAGSTESLPATQPAVAADSLVRASVEDGAKLSDFFISIIYNGEDIIAPLAGEAETLDSIKNRFLHWYFGRPEIAEKQKNGIVRAGDLLPRQVRVITLHSQTPIFGNNFIQGVLRENLQQRWEKEGKRLT